MSGGEMSPSGGNGPSGRAARFWLGLLMAAWVLVEIVTVLFCYFHMSKWRFRDGGDPEVFYRLYVTALGTSALAMLFVVGGVGFVLDRPWGRKMILRGARFQIALTVVTQIWEAIFPMTNAVFFSGILAMPLGILLWNVIPIGILMLADAAKPYKATEG